MNPSTRAAMINKVIDPWKNDPLLNMAVKRAEHALNVVMMGINNGITKLAAQPPPWPGVHRVSGLVTDHLNEHDPKFLTVWEIQVHQTTHPDSMFVSVKARDAIQRLGEIDTDEA
jgi:hypothetical protein